MWSSPSPRRAAPVPVAGQDVEDPVRPDHGVAQASEAAVVRPLGEPALDALDPVAAPGAAQPDAHQGLGPQAGDEQVAAINAAPDGGTAVPFQTTSGST